MIHNQHQEVVDNLYLLYCHRCHNLQTHWNLQDPAQLHSFEQIPNQIKCKQKLFYLFPSRKDISYFTKNCVLLNLFNWSIFKIKYLRT